jgi:hypothetical protein
MVFRKMLDSSTLFVQARREMGEKAGHNRLAQLPDAYRPTTVPEVSRRTFLKVLGLATLPLVTSLPFFDLAVWPDRDHAAEMQLHLADHARALLQDAITELQAQGFSFDLEQSILVQLPQRPHLLGLMLRDSRLPPRHDGADIALTLNLHTPQRSALTYLVGRSNADGLELRQVIVEPGRKRQQRQMHISREAGSIQQRPPVSAARGTLYQAASRSAAGHTDEPAEQSHWYYNHAGGALWLEAPRSEKTADRQLRFTTCEEYRNNRMCSAPHGHRSHDHYGETRTVSLEEAGLAPAFVCTVGRA